jgi:hypothetical protein
VEAVRVTGYLLLGIAMGALLSLLLLIGLAQLEDRLDRWRARRPVEPHRAYAAVTRRPPPSSPPRGAGGPTGRPGPPASRPALDLHPLL